MAAPSSGNDASGRVPGHAGRPSPAPSGRITAPEPAMREDLAMGPSRQEETERKYDVDTAIVFPNLAETAGVHSVGPPRTWQLEAVYFDTPRLDLARSGVTLRRRTGGSDAGWHLKLPAGPDTRTELQEPLGSERAVPQSFRTRVRALARGRTLEPVATLRTQRRQY